MKPVRYLSTVSTIAFEGSGDDEGKGDGDGETKDKEGTKGSKTPEGGDLITQSHLNHLLAEAKREHQVALRKAADLAKELSTSQSATVAEKDALAKRLEELRAASQTETEKAREDFEEAQNEATKLLKNVEKDRDLWAERYTRASIDQSLQTACNGGVKDVKAVNDEPIIAILSPNTRLVEETDEDGEPTGNLIPQVTFEDQDKSGKPVTLTISPNEAVQRMAKMDKYGNLFTGSGVGGLGGGNPGGKTGGQAGSKSLAEICRDPKLFRKMRAEGTLPVPVQE